MAVTPSTMLALGTQAPDFSLPDVSTGKAVCLGDFGARNLLVIFLSRHCPYVKHIQEELAQLGKDYVGRDLAIVAISPNDVARFPEDAPQKLAQLALELGLTFPILYDESQQVAIEYRAACTPDFFLFDASHGLVYRGQLDSSRPGSRIPVTGEDLRTAIEALLGGRPVPENQIPSVGCNIKWKSGNEPDYFGNTHSA